MMWNMKVERHMLQSLQSLAFSEKILFSLLSDWQVWLL